MDEHPKWTREEWQVWLHNEMLDETYYTYEQWVAHRLEEDAELAKRSGGHEQGQ